MALVTHGQGPMAHTRCPTITLRWQNGLIVINKETWLVGCCVNYPINIFLISAQCPIMLEAIYNTRDEVQCCNYLINNIICLLGKYFRTWL